MAIIIFFTIMVSFMLGFLTLLFLGAIPIIVANEIGDIDMYEIKHYFIKVDYLNVKVILENKVILTRNLFKEAKIYNNIFEVKEDIEKIKEIQRNNGDMVIDFAEDYPLQNSKDYEIRVHEIKTQVCGKRVEELESK